VQENAATLLSNLASNANNHAVIVAAGAISAWVALLGSESVGVQDLAAWALFNLALNEQ
jgi:hypothetical protein